MIHERGVKARSSVMTLTSLRCTRAPGRGAGGERTLTSSALGLQFRAAGVALPRMDHLARHTYSLRFAQQTPLRPDGSGRGADAFERISIELVRDDGRLAGSAVAYFPRELEPPPDFVEAAAALGSDFLVRVCERALSLEGFVLQSINDALDAGVSQAFVVEEFRVHDDGTAAPALRAMFAKALMRNLPRCIDAVFIRADATELPFWRATIGARLVDGMIVASAAARLPDDLPPPGPRKRRASKGGPRLVN